ncbi:MAG TPA: hypothetical protein VEC99_01655 [Clostridia bacterium]|nr:hypothetical protein [Clostridia bacterium]
MNRLAKLVALLLLVLWVPATAHCQLETISGLEFLACCLHPDMAPHQDNDCETDGCSVVESGHYFVPAKLQPTFRAPLLLIGLMLPDCQTEPEPDSWAQVSKEPPPEGEHVWQFSQRMALMPRAPSFYS